MLHKSAAWSLCLCVILGVGADGLFFPPSPALTARLGYSNGYLSGYNTGLVTSTGAGAYPAGPLLPPGGYQLGYSRNPYYGVGRYRVIASRPILPPPPPVDSFGSASLGPVGTIGVSNVLPSGFGVANVDGTGYAGSFNPLGTTFGNRPVAIVPPGGYVDEGGRVGNFGGVGLGIASQGIVTPLTSGFGPLLSNGGRGYYGSVPNYPYTYSNLNPYSSYYG